MIPKSFLVAALAILPTSVLAQSHDAAGTWTFTPAAESYPVREDLVVIHLNHSHDRFEPVNADHPAADASGQCFGAIVIRAGQASGSGNCHYRDGQGDALVTQWTVEGVEPDGRSRGQWEIVDGTGKWAGATGGGSYLSGPDGAGEYKAELTGEMTLN